jgi:hypothetical protein
MRRPNLGLVLTFALGITVAAAQAEAGVSADINLHVGRPAPMVVFEREPDVILVPNTRVYSVSGLDYDLFRYGQYWYINDGGYWYRARNYRGPFAAIQFNVVPRPIIYVPARYHRHPVQPMREARRRERDDDDDGVMIIRGKEKHRGKGDERGEHGDRDQKGQHGDDD